MQSDQRSSLIMTAAALLVTLVMGCLPFDNERDSRAQLIRTQGIAPLYLPGGMHWGQLYFAAVQLSLLAPRKRGQANVDFMHTAVS